MGLVCTMWLVSHVLIPSIFWGVSLPVGGREEEKARVPGQNELSPHSGVLLKDGHGSSRCRAKELSGKVESKTKADL